MRNLRLLDRYRDRENAQRIYGWHGDETCGCFCVQSPIDRAPMVVIASSAEGWDHVSVSRSNRPPNWTEMTYIHRLFFNDDEEAMQLHVPVSDHISFAVNCLHLWRPQNACIPRPPGWMVGPKKETVP
jgi:hypothetical protein